MQAKISHISTVLALLALLLFAAWPAHAQGLQTVFLDWHPGGEWLAISDFQSVKIIEVATGETVNEFLHTSGDPIRPGGPLEWSPDGMSLAFTDYQLIYVWTSSWNQAQAQLVLTYNFLEGREGASRSPLRHIRWSPNSQRFAMNVSETLYIVNAVSGETEHRIAGDFSVNDVEWISDDRIIVVTRQGYIVTMDASTGEPLTYLIEYDRPDRFNYTEIALSPTGQEAVVGSSEGGIFLWNNTQSDYPDYQTQITRWQYGRDYIDAVNDLAWSPSGQYVAVSFGNGEVAVYDAVSGEQLVSLSLGGETANNALAWSPDGSQLAYGLPDGGYALFDASTLPGYVPMETAEVSS